MSIFSRKMLLSLVLLLVVIVATILYFVLRPETTLVTQIKQTVEEKQNALPFTQTIEVSQDALQTVTQASPGGISATEERALLPEVTQVEKWQQSDSFISEEQNFAPGIISLREGGYRMYWNDYERGGITSATSQDGINFVEDSGLRLDVAYEGTDCLASHPWIVRLKNGYRMYYQVACLLKQTPDQNMYSAFSQDGLTFVREGIAVAVGQETGLTYAGHGRILPMSDGSYRMYFSANTSNMRQGEPSAILGATSIDGLNWVLDENLTLEMGHDPAIVTLNGEIHMYASFLAWNLLHLVSYDGYTFTPIAWVEFYNVDDRYFEEFGDVEALVKDGEVMLYGGGKLEGDREGYPGLIVLKKVE